MRPRAVTSGLWPRDAAQQRSSPENLAHKPGPWAKPKWGPRRRLADGELKMPLATVSGKHVARYCCGHCNCDNVFNADDVGRRHGSLSARHAHADISDVLACSGRIASSATGDAAKSASMLRVMLATCGDGRTTLTSARQMDVVDGVGRRASSGGSVGNGKLGQSDDSGRPGSYDPSLCDCLCLRG
ncbi:hypothetical protein ACLOJK_028515 [Asimina triloba]